MPAQPRVALVTGAASGIGRLTARRLLDAGARVALLDVNEGGLAETAGDRPGALPLICDVSDPAQVEEALRAARSELGPLDRVVHAAAIMPTCPLPDEDPDRARRLMRINYEGTVNVALGALAGMRPRRAGEIVLYGSVAGEVPTPHMGAYCATKAAVNMFAEVLIQENRGSGVHILLVCPPIVDTPLLNQAWEASNPRSLRLGVDQGRLMKPEALVEAVERALVKRRTILLPNSEARAIVLLRRLAPGLLWRLVLRAEALER
jgi:NAD(P)-dependent dehydrogenase (short-subunit alcohol dehydrogenase family)